MTTLLCIACRVCALVLWKMQKELPMHLLLCSHVSPPKVPPCGGANHGNRCYGQRRVKCECFPSVLPLAPPCVGANHGTWCYGKCRGKCECFPSLSPPKRGGMLPKAPHLWGGPSCVEGPVWNAKNLPAPRAGRQAKKKGRVGRETMALGTSLCIIHSIGKGLAQRFA